MGSGRRRPHGSMLSVRLLSVESLNNVSINEEDLQKSAHFHRTEVLEGGLEGGRGFCVNVCTVPSLDYVKCSRSLWLRQEAEATGLGEAGIPAPV